MSGRGEARGREITVPALAEHDETTARGIARAVAIQVATGAYRHKAPLSTGDSSPGIWPVVTDHLNAVANRPEPRHSIRDLVSRAHDEVWFRRFANGRHRNLACSRDCSTSVQRAHVRQGAARRRP
ncbi:hypothetical protein H0H10_30725 [Streptomyces sp. TRM S81-3]|uniref:Uncharacterized protein n=1 Tax=Streptomyces griseicoloratus TaxID=2752516 RepID=A0A926L8R1_9ACTN|nr:hypothetical protein [Streptomyces griseicoloratus]MBD0423479.1 hypothetical protein [Streptomyces griseicoloratus]